MDDPSQVDDQELDRLVEFTTRPRRGSWPIRRELINTITVPDLNALDALAPHRKMILYLLLLCLKDRASELRFEPRESDSEKPGIGLFYIVDGQYYELVPPPAHISRICIHELKKLGGLIPARLPLSRPLRKFSRWLAGPPRTEGSFRLKDGTDQVDLSVVMHSTPWGEGMALKFSPWRQSLSESAHARLREIMIRRREHAQSGQENGS